MPNVSPVTKVNKLLARAHLRIRVVRGRGYYYLQGEGASRMQEQGLYSLGGAILQPEQFGHLLSAVNDKLEAAGFAKISEAAKPREHVARASYREAINWIAANDDTEWLDDSPDQTPSVTAALVADLFKVSSEKVRADLVRELERIK